MRYKIYSEKVYLDRDGQKKKLSYKVGYIRVREDRAMFMRLYSQPDTVFRIVLPEEEEATENAQ